MEPQKLSAQSEPEPLDGVSSEEFRRLMAGFPTGVAVVTAMDSSGCPSGMTCSSLCSVSLDPPTLLVCLRRGSPTLESVLRSSAFTVNLMHVGARATAELFASGAVDRFARVRWRPGPRSGGPRLPDDAHAIADCRIEQLTLIGDHVVVFGAVCRVVLCSSRPPRPLLYGLRRYAEWPAADLI
jgi:flavin reductase (NADH)